MKIYEMTEEIAAQIIAAVEPHIGGFDIEAGEKWQATRQHIEYYLMEGDYSGQTIEELIEEVRSEYAEDLAAIEA